MKNVLALFLTSIVLISIFAQCNACFLLSKKDKSVLPKKTLKLIATADSIVAYRIDAMNMPADSAETLCGFALIGQSVIVRQQDAETLRALVDSASFKCPNDEIHKLSTFIPDYGFKFCLPKDSVVVLLDVHANMWTFYHKQKQYKLDNDSISNELLSLLESVFGKSLSSNSYSGTSVSNDVSLDEESKDKTSTKSEYIKLNDEILHMVTAAKTMTCYIVDPLSKNDTETEKLYKYAILQKQDVKNGDVVKSFQDLIVGNKSFEKLDVVKNCTFLPDIAFQIKEQDKVLNIMFSFYCNECEIRMNEELLFRNDCSLIQSQVVGIARQIFPKDKFLRTIQ